jgi:hypothetical protein
MSQRKPLPLRDEALHILLHSLGVQKRAGKWKVGGWRNYYSTHPDADGFSECKVLEAGGWMRSFVSQSYDGEVWTFRVTEAGIAALMLAGWKVEVET